MTKNLVILTLLAVVIALPFALRKSAAGDWKNGDPVIVAVSPHNEAIRYEFARAYSSWHAANFKRPDGSPQPVRIDWRNIGGTTEILRYLASEYAGRGKAWWQKQGGTWPRGMSEVVTAGRFATDKPPINTDEALWKQQVEIYKKFRTVDDPAAFGVGIDLFFGGGQFDHSDAFNRGFAVEPWPAASPPDLFKTADGVDLMPEKLAGETWRTPTLFGNAISTFGICYNSDRLTDLGIATPPTHWVDLTDFRYFKQLGLTDPTKSGSVAKAFEMIVHERIHEALAAKWDDKQIAAFEKLIGDYQKAQGPAYKPGDLPPAVPVEYQQTIEAAWVAGVQRMQLIAANARYFTDSATKVPIDVSVGDAAAGMAIDFYGRYQAQTSAGPDGTPRMTYVTPLGGSSVTSDPVTLLRGAPNRAEAVRFMQFILSEDGQRLWTYKPGEPGGPEKYSLRRLPVRRDFYPSTNPAIQARHEIHAPHAADALADPTVDPYTLASSFTYYPRWTGGHFSMQRDLIRSMCIDSGDELRTAWASANTSYDIERKLEMLQRLPTVRLFNKARNIQEDVPLTWKAALTLNAYDKNEYTRKWTAAFRAGYAEVLKN